MLTTATATEASSGFVSLPAGFFQRGSLLVIDFLAAISNRVTGPDTFTINIKVGSVTAFSTPTASIVYTTVTLATAFDAVLIYNSTQSNKAVSVHTFGSQTVTAGTFTLTMPTNDSSNALIRLA